MVGSECSSPTGALMEVRCAVEDVLLTTIKGALMEIRCAEGGVFLTKGGIVLGKTKIAKIYSILSTKGRIARWNKIRRSSSRETRRQSHACFSGQRGGAEKKRGATTPTT